MTKRPQATHLLQPFSRISQLVGAVSPVLPGESEDAYKNGLQATVEELGAQTPLQMYLAEKIFDCFWWIRRYERQKRAAIIREMSEVLKGARVPKHITDEQAHIIKSLEDNNWVDDALVLALGRLKQTPESLLQEAMRSSRQYLELMDQQIALRAKTLAGFQASFDVLVNRKIQSERMHLQNELLRRDLESIKVEAVVHDKPTKTSGK